MNSLPYLRALVGRSLLPLGVLLLLLAATQFGPWFLLVAAIVWWKVLCRIQ